MIEKSIVKVLALVLIVSLTVSSVMNIAEKSLQYHDSWSSWLVSIGFAVSFSLTVYVVMIAETSLTRNWAIAFAAVFGLVSAWIQTAVYLDNNASFGVALSYGVGVPGFEAALAILHAMLSKEKVQSAHTEHAAQSSTAPAIEPAIEQRNEHHLSVRSAQIAPRIERAVESAQSANLPVIAPRTEREIEFWNMLNERVQYQITALAKQWDVAPNTLRNWRQRWQDAQTQNVAQQFATGD